MKLSKNNMKFLSAAMVIFMVLHTLPLSLLAQNYLSEEEREAYVSEVTSRAALYEDLEQQKRQAEYRRETIEKSIANLQV